MNAFGSCDADSDLCTADQCDTLGACIPLGIPVECDSCSYCDADYGCVGTPNALENSGDPLDPGTCWATAQRGSSLAVRDDEDDTRDSFKGKYGRGFAQPSSAFGDPTSTTDYQVCVFGTDRNLVARSIVAADIPAGSGWQSTSKGFRYRNKKCHWRPIVKNVR